MDPKPGLVDAATARVAEAFRARAKKLRLEALIWGDVRTIAQHEIADAFDGLASELEASGKKETARLSP